MFLGLQVPRRSRGILHVTQAVSKCKHIYSKVHSSQKECAQGFRFQLAQGRVPLLSWPTHLHHIALCMTKHLPAGRSVIFFADPSRPCITIYAVR